MAKKKSVQTQSEWEEEMTYKILRFVHDELYTQFRFMSIALNALEPKADKRLTTFATDGSIMYLSPEQMIRVFQNNSKYLNRVYLHTIMHCLFSHLWIGGSRDPFLWGIACDIAVEYTIDQMKQPCVSRITGWIRQRTYERMKEECNGCSAAQIYRMLEEDSDEELQVLYQEFFTDDHVFWPKKEDNSVQMQSVQKKWNKISRQTQMEQKRHGDDSEEGQELMQFQMKAHKAKRSYQDFLRKFAVLREELHCDLDEFDMNFYTYGLQLYQNMPLLEPMESREVKKIRDFVVVVDTSYSTSGELVQKFLQETFEILCQEDSFFSKCKLHVIQCDEEIQDDIVITNQGDMERIFADFTIKGGGNTDFRPAFAYVNELLEKGEFENLCGLLYFTDGKGTYPGKKPPYQTAFIFMNEDEERQVPAWAMQYEKQS